MPDLQAQLYHAWLACSESITLKGRARLLEQHNNARQAYERFSASDLDLVGEKAWKELSDIKQAGLSALETALEKAEIRLAVYGEEGYPALLSQIADPPDLLFYKGKLPQNDARLIAIVGSRRETRYGREQAFRIAKDLSNHGIIVVSGLARGIDTAAHEGALSGGGATIGVLGSGIKRMYPKENATLANKMVAAGGAVISEFAPKAEPLACRFPFRNRVVSGLCQGVLLIEARENSGTLITVGHALTQGREVFCLPGPVDAPSSILPHRMLRDGARLVTSAADILEDMGWQASVGELQMRMILPELTAEQKRIYDSLQDEPRDFNDLAASTGFAVNALGALLTQMELEGLIETLPGRMFRLSSTN